MGQKTKSVSITTKSRTRTRFWTCVPQISYELSIISGSKSSLLFFRKKIKFVSKYEKLNFHQSLGLHEYYLGIFLVTAYGMDESKKLESSSFLICHFWHLLEHQNVLYSMCAHDSRVGIPLFHLEEKGYVFIFFFKKITLPLHSNQSSCLSPLLPLTPSRLPPTPQRR